MSNANRMTGDKIYLGDSVYAEHDDAGRLVLWTENGYGRSNLIVLEPDVYQSLVKWMQLHGDPP